MQIIDNYKCMVTKLLTGVRVSGYTHQDLVSVCNLVILEKLQLYEPTMGSFTTYLYPCLKGRIMNLHRDQFRKKQNALSTCVYWESIVDEDGNSMPMPSNQNVEAEVEVEMMYGWYMDKAKEILSRDHYNVFRACVEHSQGYAVKKFHKRQSSVNSIYNRTLKKLRVLEGKR